MEVDVSSGSMFSILFQKFSWKEIPNCPGRFLLCKDDNIRVRFVTPIDFLDQKVNVRVFSSNVCRDKVHIGRFNDFEGGGLLSYQKDDGFVHSLNTNTGLKRKMDHLGLSFS